MSLKYQYGKNNGCYQVCTGDLQVLGLISPSLVAVVVLYLTIVLIGSLEIKIERREGGEGRESGREEEREGGKELP